MFKEQKGITLVALVITIIVLLILAGVSISLVLGDNGVLTQATDAVKANQIATVREKVITSFAAVDVAFYSEWASNQSVTRSQVYKAELVDELKRNSLNSENEITDSEGTVVATVTIDADAYLVDAADLVVTFDGAAYEFKDVKVDDKGTLTLPDDVTVIKAE